MKTYTKQQLEKMPLNKLQDISTKIATDYYKSGKHNISFGDNVNYEEIARELAMRGSKSTLLKDILAMQKKLKD